MLKLEDNANKIITDSGGVQKEAYFSETPCITLREETEWVETVKEGWNTLVGTDKSKIIKAIKDFNPKTKPEYVFGNGNASEKIKDIIEGYKI